MKDTFNREINYLRISVTDRCDLRCIYCMKEKMEFLPKSQILSVEEINRICSVFINLGIKKIRITGGEPLVRKGVPILLNYLGKKINNSNYYLFDPNPNVQNYIKELLENENVKYFQLALDNTNMKKKFTINRYFEASGSSLKSAHREDRLYNLSRKAFMKLFQPFKKILLTSKKFSS